MRRLAVTAIAVSIAGAFAAPAMRVSAQPDERRGITIALTEVPSSRQDDPRALAYIIDHVSAGSTFSRSIRVTNDTDGRTTLDLYAVAASVVDGSFTVGADRAENELTRWITVEPAEVDLGPGESSPATVTVAVPPGADDGERYAGVMAEASRTNDGAGIVERHRVGIRVYLSVGAGGEPSSDFAIESLTAGRTETGEPVVNAQVGNTGGRALDLRGELQLEDGPGGTAAGPFPAELGTTLAPGDVDDVTVHLDPELPSGPWLATLTLRSGTLERAAEATITFPDEPGTSARPVPADPVERARRVLLPIAILLVLLVLAGLLWYWRRRRRRRAEDDHSVP